MTHLTPDLAFRVLKHLSVRELLTTEPVNLFFFGSFYFYDAFFFFFLLHTLSKIGFTQMASYGSSSFYLEVSLSQHNRH